MGSTSILGPGSRTLGGQSAGIDIAADATKTARHFIIEAYKREGMTHEQAVERYNNLSGSDVDRLTEGVYASARQNEDGNLNTLLGKVGRTGMTGLALLEAGGEDAYEDLMDQGFSVSVMRRNDVATANARMVSHYGPPSPDGRREPQVVYTRAVSEITNRSLLTGSSAEITSTDFRRKLEDFGDLYTKLGDTLGQLSAQMRTFIVREGSLYVGKEELAVTNFLRELGAEQKSKVDRLSSSEKEQLKTHLKNIIMATGATTGRGATNEQLAYRTLDTQKFTDQINRLGVTGIESKRRGMAEEMLKDNPLAQLFGETGSSAATTRFLDFMRQGRITLSRDQGILQVDQSINRTLGGDMSRLSEDVQERLRQLFVTTFAGVQEGDTARMEEASKRFRQGVLNLMGSAPVPGQDSSGDTSVAAAATKINMLIQAAAGVIQALAIEDTQAARDKLESVKSTLATLATPSNAASVRRAGG
jgi:hypothetical protein